MKKILNSILLTLIVTLSFGQTTHTINAGSFYYTPSSLTVDLGDSVIWINDGGFHDVNGDINTVGSHAANGMIGSVIVEDNTSNISEISMSMSSLSYDQISNCLYLKFISLEKNTNLQLHNIEGKLIQTQNIKSNPGLSDLVIPINSSLKKGIYIVSLINKEQKISEKILIN